MTNTNWRYFYSYCPNTDALADWVTGAYGVNDETNLPNYQWDSNLSNLGKPYIDSGIINDITNEPILIPDHQSNETLGVIALTDTELSAYMPYLIIPEDGHYKLVIGTYVDDSPIYHEFYDIGLRETVITNHPNIYEPSIGFLAGIQ